MTTCQFCNLPVAALYAVYDIQVCIDCTDLAEIAYSGDEESDYIENLAFDIWADR